MSRGTEDFEALIRSANPVPRDAEPAISMRQLAVRDEIMRSKRAPRVGRRPIWVAVWAPLVALAVTFLVVVSVSPGEEASAVITTPKALEFRDEGQTLDDVINQAGRNLARNEGPPTATRLVQTTGWYYQVDGVDSDSPRKVISPEVTTLQWNEDGSGYTRTVAGEPYWADGGDGEFPSSTATPGTLLWEMEFEPGDFNSPVVTPPGSSEADMRDMLRAYGVEDESNAFEVMNAINTITNSWTLTDEQHAGLLYAILQTDDARLLGAATDRAGRPVAGIAATLPGGTAELHLFVSQETGRIVGSETYTLKADYPFPAEAIISYRIWDLATP
ncbi:UNVERIFIED_CONTAM: hypothetical protein OHV15_06400 [Microbacterium sp. SLM126]